MGLYERNKREHPIEHAKAKREYAQANGVNGGTIERTPEFEAFMARRIAEMLGANNPAMTSVSPPPAMTSIDASPAPRRAPPPAFTPAPAPYTPMTEGPWRGIAFLLGMLGIIGWIIMAVKGPPKVDGTAWVLAILPTVISILLFTVCGGIGLAAIMSSASGY